MARPHHGSAATSRPRFELDRRVAALLFVLITIGLPLRAVHHVGDAIDASTLRAWLAAADAGLRASVGAAFAVFIYRRKPSRSPARSVWAFVSCAAAILPAIFLAAPGDDASLTAIIAGESLVVLAVAFTLASVLSLGTCFGVLPEARGLVTRGPYRLVRHPVYVGEIGAFAGFVLASQRPANAVLLIVFVAAQLARLRLEEAALLAAFPDEYGAFAARTPRLIPSLRRARPGLTTTDAIARTA